MILKRNKKANKFLGSDLHKFHNLNILIYFIGSMRVKNLTLFVKIKVMKLMKV